MQVVEGEFEDGKEEKELHQPATPHTVHVDLRQRRESSEGVRDEGVKGCIYPPKKQPETRMDYSKR